MAPFTTWGTDTHLLKLMALTQFTTPIISFLDRQSRIIIPAAILMASLVIPFAVPDLMLYLLALLIAAAAGIILARNTQFGLLCIVLSILVRFDGPSGFNLTMVVVAAVTGLWFLGMIGKQRSIRFGETRVLRPLLIFVLVSIISFGFGQLQWFSFAQGASLGAQAGGLSIVILSACALLVVANQLQELRWLEYMSWTVVGLLAFNTLGWLIPPLGELRDQFISGKALGSLFWMWGVTIAFSQAFLNRKLHIGLRFALGILVFLTIYVGTNVIFDWKSGWVPPLISVLAIISLYFLRYLLFILPFGLLPIASFVNNLIATDTYSFGTRVDAWIIVLNMAKVSPIWGLGFGNYSRYAILFPIRGYNVYFNSHSQYVDLIAQTGFLGLACFIWIFWALLRTSMALRLRLSPDSGFAYAYVYGAIGGIVGTLVSAALGDWVLPFFFNVGLSGFRASVLGWVFLGGLVAIEQMVNRGVLPSIKHPLDEEKECF